MKVKALINYYDKELKRDIQAGVIYEVESEERLKELLGENDKKLICCVVLNDSEKDDEDNTPAETEKAKTKGKKNAKNK